MMQASRYPFCALAILAACLPGPALANARIVNGVPATIEEAPWHVLFDMQGECGASWIGKRWVLTAAHCVEDSRKDGHIYAGMTMNSEKKTATRIPIKSYFVHPDYASKGRDIALLELSADITAPKAKPVRLVTPADATAGLTAVGKAGRLTGWGMAASGNAGRTRVSIRAFPPSRPGSRG